MNSQDTLRRSVEALFPDLAARTDRAEALAQVVNAFSPVHFPKGSDIIREGDPGDYLYVITAGSADVYQHAQPDGPVGRLSEGNFFGELALMTDEKRNSTIRAATDVECYRLSKDRFEGLAASIPSFFASFSKTLYARLTEGYRALQKSMDQRIALTAILQKLLFLLCFYCLAFVLITSYLPVSRFMQVSLCIRAVEIFAFLLVMTQLHKVDITMRDIGFTKKNLGRSLIETAVVLVPFLAGMIGTKALMVSNGIHLYGETLFSGQINYVFYLYPLVVLIQEFLMRSIFLMMERFLASKHPAVSAVVLSTLVFSLLHLFISLDYYVITIFLGLIWGFLFARQRNISGVLLFHFCVGLLGGFLGFGLY